MVDKNLLLRKLSELETYYDQIKEYSDITVDNYKSDWKIQRIIERTLQIMIETCVDVANHIISDKKMRPPISYADAFRILFENNIIETELLDIMEKMAKFRNIVVHQYEDVNAEIVSVIIIKHLGDFLKYKEAILCSLKE